MTGFDDENGRAIQGDLFGGWGETKPKPVVKPKERGKVETSPRSKMDAGKFHEIKTFYTYEEFRTIFNGNHSLAHYWWSRMIKNKEKEMGQCL